MEFWLILTIVASVAASISAFFDNYITDEFFKGRTPQAQKCFYGPINFLLGLALVVIYLINSPTGFPPLSNALLLVLSGMMAALASLPYYLALKSEDTTGAIIFCQLYPIFYLVMGFLFLGEQITQVQLIAFVLLMSAPLAILLLTGKRRKRMEYRAAFLLLIHVILSPLSAIIFIFAERGIESTITNDLSIMLAIGLMFAGKGIFDFAAIALNKKWRQRSKRVLKESKNKVLIPVIINSLVWLFADYGVRRAMISEQVAIVSAVNLAVELLATFVLGLVLTIIWPRFGREKLEKRTVLAHFIATILALIGIILVEKPDIFLGM